MRSSDGGSAGVAALLDAARLLAVADLSDVPDAGRLAELRQLWPALCAVHAQLARRVGDVHAAGAARGDGFVSTAAFLRHRWHVDPGRAALLVKVGSGLSGLADTAAAVAEGAISLEHGAAVVDAAADLGEAVMARGVEKVLVDFAREHTPAEVRRLARLIKLRLLDDDEAAARQVRLHQGRWLTASTTFAGMVHLEAMLDPVLGAQLLAALAAYTAGPDPDGPAGRTARQRRADALGDICAAALADPDRSEQGGEKAHVTVTVSFETLARHLADTLNRTSGNPGPPAAGAEASPKDSDTAPGGNTVGAGGRGPETGDGPGGTGVDGDQTGPAGAGADHGNSDGGDRRTAQGEPGSGRVAGGDRPAAQGEPEAGDGGDRAADGECGYAGGDEADWGWAADGVPWAGFDRDPVAEALAGLFDYLGPGGPALLGHSHEPICAETARRLACDAGIIPVLLGSRSEPLDIGRLSRVIPAGIRRAVELRDQHCRFPGCDRPAKWCDCHHVRFWRDGGPTTVENLVLTCRFHHMCVHEYGWTLSFNPITGVVRVLRPDGTPYDIVSQRDGPSP